MKSKIRVLIADDHAIVRMGLASLLGTKKDIEVVGEAEDGEETHCGAECHSASFHQTHEQEDAHGHQDEDEHEVAAQAAGIIEFVGDE